jgi:hypothetical protein
MFTYDLINVKTGEVRKDLKPSTVEALVGIKSSDVNRYARNEYLHDKTYKVVINRNVDSNMVNAYPRELLEEWDNVTSKFRRYYSNERVS